MFGQKPKQQIQVQSPLLEKHHALTPEESEILKQIFFDSNEVYSRTFLPLVLVNRPLVINKLQNMKKNIDKLVEVL